MGANERDRRDSAAVTHRADAASSSLSWLLDCLRCPDCGGAFTFDASAKQPLPGGAFGVLSCGAHAYPVVDSIPVIRRDRVDVQDHVTHRVDVAGPTVEELIDKVRRDPLDALVSLLAFPPSLPFKLGRIPGARQSLTRGPAAWVGLNVRRANVRRRLGRLEGQSAQDWLELSYRRTRDVTSYNLYPYFLTRFSQPRYLASLSLVSTLQGGGAPVLDLACGLGHVMYHLAARPQSVRGVGVDRNFFQLWVGRRWIARSNNYVCADASLPLPFADGSFSASLCSDAFHLLPRKQECVAELRRCAQGGLVIIDHVGNGLIEPRDLESEPTPQGYLDLVGDVPCRMVSESELLEGYLLGLGPQLAAVQEAQAFAREKWLAMVISDDSRLFVDHGPLNGMPHAEGHLGLNPMYRVERLGNDVRLRFEFPTTWHAFENARMLEYHEWGLTLSREEFDAALSGQQTQHTLDLARRFVLIGMPENYLRPIEL